MISAHKVYKNYYQAWNYTDTMDSGAPGLDLGALSKDFHRLKICKVKMALPSERCNSRPACP